MYLLILKVTQAQQDNITHAYPHPLAQLAADMAKSVDPVETESFHPTVAEHARHLGIFCSPWKRTQGQPLGKERRARQNFGHSATAHLVRPP